MRTFRVDKKLVDAEIRLLRDPLYLQERPKVVDLISRLQTARTTEDYIDLHVRLLTGLRARQEVMRELRDQAQEVRKRISELARKHDKDPDALRGGQRRLDLLEHQERVQGALRFALLNIGDGLAWRALDYDRTGIAVLGDGERVAWLADKEGFDSEVAVLERYWEKGVFAFHNDITTCIRHGDVTALTPEGVALIEVKRGRSRPNSPQMRRLEDATSLLNKGKHVGQDGQLKTVVDVGQPYRTYLANLGDLIGRAKHSGYAAGKLGQVQFASVVNHLALPQNERTQRLHPQALKKLGWFEGVPRLFTFTTAERRMRDRRYSFAVIAPFSVYPFPADDVADLVLGYIDFLSILNVDLLERALIQKGHSVQIVGAQAPNVGEQFLTATRRIGEYELSVRVDVAPREQMLMELMTPASVSTALNAILDRAETLQESMDREVGRIPRMDERHTWGR